MPDMEFIDHSSKSILLIDFSKAKDGQEIVEIAEEAMRYKDNSKTSYKSKFTQIPDPKDENQRIFEGTFENIRGTIRFYGIKGMNYITKLTIGHHQCASFGFQERRASGEKTSD